MNELFNYLEEFRNKLKFVDSGFYRCG